MYKAISEDWVVVVLSDDENSIINYLKNNTENQDKLIKSGLSIAYGMRRFKSIQILLEKQKEIDNE